MSGASRPVGSRSTITQRLSVTTIPGLKLVAPGDDVGALIADAIADTDPLQDGDVVVVAQKIVSKAEARVVPLAQVSPGARAQEVAARAGKDPAVVELMIAEAAELMRVAPGVVITRHRSGHVLANAGIDASNLGAGDAEVLLWPIDPDASARRIRATLQTRCGRRIAVIISDSLGRAWRLGTTGTAIGVAGLRPLRDRRGETDLFGRILQATLIGVADEIAAAASLVIGEAAEGTPVAIVRGAVYDSAETTAAADMLRPLNEDLFR